MDCESTGEHDLEDTNSQWIKCRFLGCEWEGVRFQLGQDAWAEDIRGSHERHCRHNIAN